MEEVLTYHNIYVVYTKEAETADQYIEKTVHRIGRQYQVTVATSDGLEQVIIMGQGAHRISAQGLKKEIEDTEKNARAEWHQQRQSSKTYLFDHMSEELQAQMEKIRLGMAGEGIKNDYLYRRNKTGICIDRVYGYDTIVELPDMLEGFPVTELGAYIFSDHIVDRIKNDAGK